MTVTISSAKPFVPASTSAEPSSPPQGPSPAMAKRSALHGSLEGLPSRRAPGEGVERGTSPALRAPLPQPSALQRAVSLPHFGNAGSSAAGSHEGAEQVGARLLGSTVVRSDSTLASISSHPAAPSALDIEELATPGVLSARASNAGSVNSADGHVSTSELQLLTMGGRMTELMANRIPGVAPGAPLPEDIQARIAANRAVLLDKGIDTPQKLNQFLSQAWRHDAALAVVGMGLADGGGYTMGLTAAQEKLVALLPPKLLGNTPRLGLYVGLGVGALDVLFSVVGGEMVKPKLYNGSDGNAKLPPSVKLPTFSESVLRNVAISTGFNVAKNSLRLPVPAIQSRIEGRGDHAVDRVWSDRIDATMIDGGLGMVANGLKAMHKLTDAVPYDTRLLLRDDLGAVIDKTRKPWGQAAAELVPAAGRGLAAMVTSPVPLAVMGVVGMFVSNVFAANATIDRTNNPVGLGPGRADVDMVTAKRADSVMMFALMTGLIELGAPFVGQAGSLAASALRTQGGHAVEFVRSQAGQMHMPDVMGWAQGFFAQPGADLPDIEMGFQGGAHQA